MTPRHQRAPGDSEAPAVPMHQWHLLAEKCCFSNALWWLLLHGMLVENWLTISFHCLLWYKRYSDQNRKLGVYSQCHLYHWQILVCTYTCYLHLKWTHSNTHIIAHPAIRTTAIPLVHIRYIPTYILSSNTHSPTWNLWFIYRTMCKIVDFDLVNHH